MWIYYSLIALLLWGLWGFFAKIASNYIGYQAVYLWGSLGALMITIFTILQGFRFEFHTEGIIYALLAGLTGGGGVIFFYYAMKDGKASVVVTITALYPLITILMSSLILKEEISLRQAAGIIFALIAMALMAG